MAQYWLMNNTLFGANQLYAGTKLDSAFDDTVGIAAAGGRLIVVGSSATIDAAAAAAQSARLRGGSPAEIESIMNAGGDTEEASDTATLIADLASTNPAKGAALLGYDGGTTVKAALDANVALQKRTVQITHADLTQAGNGVAQAINIGAVLPANANVLAAEVNIATLFSGGGATAVKLDLGGTDADAIAAQHDVFTGAATGALTPTPAGVHQRGKFSAEQLVATFTPDGGHSLLNLTAGDLTVTIWYSVLA